MSHMYSSTESVCTALCATAWSCWAYAKRIRRLAILALILTVSVCEAPMAQVVSTVVGGGVGDNGPALEASVNWPGGMALDSQGNLYFTESNRVRRISPDGLVVTVAGSAVEGFSGDGGAASQALLKWPKDVFLDADDNIFVLDAGNGRLRKIDRNGIITTIAGGGSGGDGGLATEANLRYPVSGTMGPDGDIFINVDNVYIKRISTSGIISNYAGNGTSHAYTGDGANANTVGLGYAQGLTADAQGNLYVASYGSSRILKLSPAGGVESIAGGGLGGPGDGGPATSAQLMSPNSVVLDEQGNLYVSEYMGYRVRKIDAAGTISTVAGNGSANPPVEGGRATESPLGNPHGIAVGASSEVFIGQSGSIRRVSPEGILETYAGGNAISLAEGGSAADASLDSAADVVFDADGNMYVADASNHRVRKVSPAGVITTVVGTGEPGFAGDGAAALSATLSWPESVAVDPMGALHILDSQNFRVRKIDSSGIITTVVGDGTRIYGGDSDSATRVGLAAPSAIAFDASGNLLIADEAYCAVRMVLPGGAIKTIAGGSCGLPFGDGGPAIEARLSSPAGLAVGPDGGVYVSESHSHRVRKFVIGGDITTVAGTGEGGFSGDGGAGTEAKLGMPVGLAVDSFGNVAISTWADSRIRLVSSSGTITTLAGTGRSGFSGDGGAPTAAQFSNPMGMAFDGAGDLFIADFYNKRVRRVSASGLAATVPGKPRSVVATAGDGVATVTFEPPSSDGGSAITGYVVTATPSGGNDAYSGGLSRSRVITGLVNGTSYSFTVKALNSVGFGLPSSPSNAVTPMPTPRLSIADVALQEGNTGSKQVEFVVQLSRASEQDVTFTLETDGTVALPDYDYLAIAPTAQRIPAGVQSLTLSVTVLGDTLVEQHESFAVVARNISGAIGTHTAAGNNSVGQVTILNDDTYRLSVEDAVVIEGNQGKRVLAFAITASDGGSRLIHPVTFDVSTEDGTAAAGADYQAATQIGVELNTFNTSWFQVEVNGDTDPENDESLHVVLSNVRGAAIGRGRATGTIYNDDIEGASPPIVNDDEYALSSGSALVLERANGVLANDIEASGTVLQASMKVGPSHGYVTRWEKEGWFIYTSRSDFVGVDEITYEACNVAGLCSLGKIKLRVGLHASAQDHYAWFLPEASNVQQQGFIRLRNLSEHSGVVLLSGVDSSGARSNSVSLTLAGRESRQFNSQDLQHGNPNKGLTGSLGEGRGDWSLVARSELDIEFLSYVRTPDGFLTSIGDRVPSAGPLLWTVPFFNPAQNVNQVSRLRLVNPGSRYASFIISGISDAGETGEAQVTGGVPPGGSLDLRSTDLEGGNPNKGLSGRLGDRVGKWQLTVEATEPLAVQSLLFDPKGYVTNLSTLPELTESALGERTLWFVPSAANTQQQGFLRLVNRGAATDVVLWGIDDAGQRSPGTVSLSVAENSAVQMTSGDLENGNAEKGLIGALGSGVGDWRIVLVSDSADLLPMSLIRTPDGFLTSIHDVLDGDGLNHLAPMFNPAKNTNQVSWLRLINPHAVEVSISISARDDAGQVAPGGVVSLSLPPGRSIELSASDLESGNPSKGLLGGLGAGSGKWELFIRSSGAIKALSLMRDPKGYLTNLSSSTKGTSDTLPD